MFQLGLWCHRSSGSWRSHCSGASLGSRCSEPTFATMEYSRADTGAWRWGQAVAFWTFPWLRIWEQWHCNNLYQSTACHPESRKCPPHQAWFLRHPIGSLVCLQCAENCLYTWGRCSSGCPLVNQWRRCTSCGPIAFTASTQWSCCRHPCSRQHSDTHLLSIGHPSQPGDHELGFPHVNTEPFIFHASLPCLELGIHSFWMSVMSTRSSS